MRLNKGAVVVMWEYLRNPAYFPNQKDPVDGTHVANNFVDAFEFISQLEKQHGEFLEYVDVKIRVLENQ